MDLNFERWEINSTILLINGINSMRTQYYCDVMRRLCLKDICRRYPTNTQSHEIFVMFKLNVKFYIYIYIYSKKGILKITILWTILKAKLQKDPLGLDQLEYETR